MASSRARTTTTPSLLVAAASALLLLLVLAPHGAAQPSAASPPAPSSGSGGCTMEIVSLTPCLGYISGNASKPSSSCCSALASVVASNPRCLCVVLGGGAASLGVAVNDTRALQLPAACSVKTPPASQCKSVGVPVPSPPATPATPTTPASPETPAVPTVAPATGAGTNTSTQAAQSSGGRSVGESVLPVAAAALSAAFALLQA